MTGDELTIRYKGEMAKGWESVDHVIKVPNAQSQKVELELYSLVRRLLLLLSYRLLLTNKLTKLAKNVTGSEGRFNRSKRPSLPVTFSLVFDFATKTMYLV